MKKNFNRMPKGIVDKAMASDSQYFKVGVKIKVTEENIKRYEHLGVKFIGKMLIGNGKVLPPIESGRYSKYNREGRRIIRKDLPKVDKIFCSECYPYGNTNSSMVSYSYVKKVWQVEEWLPQFLKIAISIEGENGEFIAWCEVDTVLDKQSDSFEDELLYAINLLQENVGKFEVYPQDDEPNDRTKWEQVDWELLPPGEIDEKFVKKYFGEKLETEQKEILDRYNFIQSLSPTNMIKGTNYFSKYFGAQFKNNVVVLENIEGGNAIYVFQKNWEEFSKLSRNELRKMNSKEITRIVHNGNWKKKLECEVYRKDVIKNESYANEHK